MANQAAEEFFSNLPSETETEQTFDVFKEPESKKEDGQPVAEKPEETTPEPEEIERKKPLRSERRLEKQTEFMQRQWQEERDARIRLEEQVKALAESRQIEVDPDIQRLLTETKDPKEATAIFQSLMQKMRNEAEESALARMQELQAQGDDEVNSIVATIEDSIESIEDRYGVDLTNDLDTRRAFLDFADSIAPEDSDALPNMDTAWKLFQSTRKAPLSNVARKQEIAARGMVRSTNAKPEGKDLKPMSFEEMNRSGWWDKLIGRS